jgi:hypothetical protein
MLSVTAQPKSGVDQHGTGRLERGSQQGYHAIPQDRDVTGRR